MIFGLISTSTFALVTASPFYAFAQSDIVGKIVVVFLLFISVYIWTVMIEKWLLLSKYRKKTLNFKSIFRKKEYPLSIYNTGKRESGPLGEVYRLGARELLTYYKLSQDNAEYYGTDICEKQKLSTAQIETIRSIMERGVSDKILELEERMGLLATVVSASPFLGLFGTVWGVMMAFCSMAIEGRANIGGMAPGISGALLTTVIALVVAIPSLIGYNFLTNNIRQLTVYMDNFVEEFMSKVKLEQHD